MKTIICHFSLFALLVLKSYGATYVVTSLADAGAGSLRQHITSANGVAGPHTISFQAGLTGTIVLASALPSFSRQITVQATAIGDITINANGNNQAFVFNNTASAGSILRRLVINNAGNINVEINGVNTITLDQCYIGTNTAGTASASPGAFHGVYMYNSSGSIISSSLVSGHKNEGVYLNGCNNISITASKIGTNAAGTASVFNGNNGVLLQSTTSSSILNSVISGNHTHGINMQSASNDNAVRGCIIGLNVTGNAVVPNYHGIQVTQGSLRVVIGGNNVADRNIISGNGNISGSGQGIGIRIAADGGASSDNAQIINNYIGTDITGNTSLGNYEHGILIYESSAAQVLNNVISGNRMFGLNILFSGNDIIKGNKIGTDVAGTIALPNASSNPASISGFNCSDAGAITIGGIGAGEGNVISGNAGAGLTFSNTGSIALTNNYIGVNAAGTGALGNGGQGIYATSSATHTLIGNVISANYSDGLYYENASNDLVIKGNFIGTDKTGGGSPVLLGNGINGMTIRNGSLNTVIGGALPSERNIISGNGRRYNTAANGTGIFIENGCTGFSIRNNYVGIQADGSTAMGNGENGIVINAGCNNGIIGGCAVSDRNIISSNGTKVTGVGQGLVINACDDIEVLGNYFGTDASGTLARGNRQSGMITIFCKNIEIGRASSGCGNLLSDNGELGVHIVGGDNNILYHNKIGVTATNAALGNGSGGVFILGVTSNATTGSNHIIGGTLTNQANVIAHSKGTGPTQFGNGFGVGVAHNQNGINNRIIGNSIYCNASMLDIDLNFSGAFGGTGVNGVGNGGKSTPVITLSTANTASGTGTNGDVVHVYSNNTSCGCEGEQYIGMATVSGGNWSLTHNLGLTAAQALQVSATSTSAIGTSQFYCIALPVRWLSITANLSNDRSVLLEWSTAQEVNNDFFVLMKSTDGIHFSELDTVDGSGSIHYVSVYSYLDKQVEAGVVYYKVMQVDDDHQRTFSPVVQVYSEDRSAFISYDSEHVYLNYFKAGINYQIIDITGRVVHEERMYTAIQEIKTDYLISGTYFLKIHASEKVEVLSFVVR